jgi:hypothetical protein
MPPSGPPLAPLPMVTVPAPVAEPLVLSKVPPAMVHFA